MWLKKCTCFLLACVAVFGCLFMAMAAYNDNLQTTTIETNDGVIFEIKETR